MDGWAPEPSRAAEENAEGPSLASDAVTAAEGAGGGAAAAGEGGPEARDGGGSAPEHLEDAASATARKRRRVVGACLALLAGGDEAGRARREWRDQLAREKAQYCHEHDAQVADAKEQLEVTREANDEMYALDCIRLKRFAHLSMALGTALGRLEVKQRTKQWQKPRSQAWWIACADPSFPADEFQRLFRMSRETFHLICEKIGAPVLRQLTRMRAPLPLEQRVAAGVWRLVTADPLLLVSKRFGMGVSTAQKTSLDVCAALADYAMPQYVEWPMGEALAEVTRGFEELCGIPQVVGVLYTSHISISSPYSALTDYHNKHHTERFKRPSYSMAIQAVVDHRGLFTDLCLGYPGSLSDEQILEKSTLIQRVRSGALAGHWVLGARSYPLSDWLLVPYPPGPQLTWVQKHFNDRMAEGIAVAKQAFTRLKARWRFLTKRAESSIGDLPSIFGACCVLHNICERRGEPFDPAWGKEVFDDFVEAKRADHEAPSAMQERDRIAHELYQSMQNWDAADGGLLA